MSLTLFVSLALGIYLFSRFYFHPRCLRIARDPNASLARVATGLLEVCGLVITASWVAVVAAGLFAWKLWSLLTPSPTTLAAVRELQAEVRHFLQQVQALELGWFIVALIAGLVALAVYLYRKSLLRLDGVKEAMIGRERRRIQDELASGNLEYVPPNQGMAELNNKLVNYHKELTELQKSTPANNVERDDLRVDREYLERRLQQTLEQIKQLDIDRRIHIDLRPEDIELPDPQTPWEKFTVLFISTGFLGGLSRLSKLAVLLLVAAAMPCMVGLTRGPVLLKLDVKASQLALVEGNLIIGANAAELEETYRQVKADIGQEQTATPTDEDDENQQLANSMGAAFEARLIKASSGSPPSARNESEFNAEARKARSEQARCEILKLHAMTQGSVEYQTADSEEHVRRRNEIISAHQERRHPMPKTEAGKQMAGDVQELLNKRGSPERKRMSEAVRQLDAELPAGSPEWTASRKLAAAHLAQSESGADVTSTKTWQRDSARETFVKVAKGEPVTQTVSSVPATQTKPTLRPEHLSAALAQMPPQRLASEMADSLRMTESEGWLRTSTGDVASGERAMRSATEMFLKRGGHNVHADARDVVARFDDIFPAHEANATGTLFDLLTRRWSSGEIASANKDLRPYEGGLRSGLPAWSPPIPLDFNDGGFRLSLGSQAIKVKRARSFLRLTGFSRIGGVLIGNAPVKPNALLPVRDLSWTPFDSSHQTQLTLTFADDGKSVTSVVHDADLVYHALSYAADARPTTVTMVSAGDMPFLKILLHPALLDTRLGVELTDLDRFAEAFGIAGFREFDEAYTYAKVATIAYGLAWATQALPTIEHESQGVRLRVQGDDEAYCKRLAGGIAAAYSKPEMQSALALLFQFDGDWLAAHSPLSKAEFYDQRLVRWMRDAINAVRTQPRVLSEAGKVSAFTTELRTRTVRVLAAQRRSGRLRRGVRQAVEPASDPMQKAADAKDADALTAAYQKRPPELQFWSGVREIDYPLTPGALCMSTTDVSGVSPLRFMMQAAFTTAPEFVGNDAKEDYYDQQPWDFTVSIKDQSSRLRDGMRERIDAAAAADKEGAGRTLRRAEQFTLLQRLFRNAFEGRLGDAFPMEKLTQLAREASNHLPPHQHTQRWNAFGSFNPFTGMLNAAIDEVRKADPALPGLKVVDAALAKFDDIAAHAHDQIEKLVDNTPVEKRTEAQWQGGWKLRWQAFEAEETHAFQQIASAVDAALESKGISVAVRDGLEKADYVLVHYRAAEAEGFPEDRRAYWEQSTPADLQRRRAAEMERLRPLFEQFRRE